MVWKALESYGVDSRGLFEQAGLDPDKIRDPDARYSEPASERLWQLAAEATRDPCFGLKLAQYWHPSSLHALGFAWMASTSLREALERLTRYSRMVVVGERLVLEKEGQDYKLTIVTPEEYPSAPDEVYDTFIAVILEMCRGSYGPELNPRKVRLRRSAPRCSGEFFAVFRSPIEFSAAENALLLGDAEVNAPLPTANAEMARASDKIIADYLAHVDRSQIAVQVKAKLIDRLPSGNVTEEDIAEALHMSLRSLQRKLKEEGTSYKQVLDETRHGLATQYIRSSRISINEITYMLGFSEPSNFSRAFKRWTGTSPTEYRASV
jgi:AraC-like DNA-binding protein